MLTIRALLGLFLALLAPGYALSFLLFPFRGTLSMMERLMLALAGSVALTSLAVYSMLQVGLALSPLRIVLLLSALCAVLVAGGMLRRRLRREPLITGSSTVRWRNPLSPLAVLCLLALILAVTGAEILTPRQPVRLTEFYITPTWLQLSQDEPFPARVQAVPVTINNLERKSMYYTIKASFDNELVWVYHDIYLDDGTQSTEYINLAPYDADSAHLLTIELFKGKSSAASATLTLALGNRSSQP